MTDEGHTVHFCINKKPGNKLKSLTETVKLYFNGCPTFYNQVWESKSKKIKEKPKYVRQMLKVYSSQMSLGAVKIYEKMFIPKKIISS